MCLRERCTVACGCMPVLFQVGRLTAVLSRTCRFGVSLVGLGAAVASSIANESIVQLPEFKIEGTAWRYGRIGDDVEVLARASEARTRAFVAALMRGQRLLPAFLVDKVGVPLRVVLVDESPKAIAGLPQLEQGDADQRDWPARYTRHRGTQIEGVRAGIHLVALNLTGIDEIPLIRTGRAEASLKARVPAFPSWVVAGLFGSCGVLRSAIGLPRTISVQLPRLSWPDPEVEPGNFPDEAANLPAFALMFDPTTNRETLSEPDGRKFDFQTALFARWSLFGPAKRGRSPNGYWAFAEMARRGQTTEAIFRECYGMDWAQASAEMRAYLKPRNVGMLEVRIPHVMAEVPEVTRMEFRDATPEEVRRILGEFNRLRVAEEAKRDKATEASVLKPAS